MHKGKHESRSLDKGSSFFGKIGMLFMDVEIEGKKQGYERASKEYGKAFSAIEMEFKKTKDLIEKQKNTYETQTEELIEMYDRLKRLSAELERQVNLKANDISKRYNIPIGDIKHTMEAGAGALIESRSIVFSILGMIYNYKEKKLREAEQRGYIEVRDLYEIKIKKLKDELKRLNENANKDIQQLLSLISEMLDIIAKEQMKIAELKILL